MPETESNSNSNSTLASTIPERKSAESESTWRLGDLVVNRVGLGVKRLVGTGAVGRDEPGPEVIALLRRAVDLGVNHLDTAGFYPTLATAGQTREFTGLNWANDAIRLALAPYPGDLVIATKVGPTEAGLARPDQLRGIVENDLRQLGLDCLDLVYLRQAGLTSIAEHFGVLAELRERGMIRHLGLSNVRAEHLAQAQEIAPVVAVQNRYGVDFGRVNDDMLTLCGTHGIAFVPFFSLAGPGREAGGVTGSDPTVDVAGRHGVTPAQIRIAWTLHRGRHVLAIPGTSDESHLADNVAAGSIRLSESDLVALDSSPSLG